MTVFVLMREVAYEFCDCWGVFTSKEKAEEHRDKIKGERWVVGDEWEIYEKVLDEGDVL